MATFASNSGRWATASRNLLLLFIVLLVFLKRSATCLGAPELATSANETSSDELNSNSNSNSNPNSMENSNNPNETNNQTLIINEDQLKFPLYMRLLATLACLVIFTIGVCGNLLVPLVVIKTKYLRNSTNLFLINLSIADLLVLIVCMPTVLIELHSRPETWLLGEPMCKVSNFVEMFAANGSIFTILAISFERYYAICKPLKAGYKCTRLRATIIIGLIWLLSTVLTSPILIMAKSSETSYIDGSLVHNCILETNTYWPKMYVFVSMFAFFCLPLLVLMLVYWLISRRLIRETIAGAAGSGGGGLSGDHCCNGSANKSASVMVAECCCCPGETSHNNNNNNNNRTIRRKVQAGTKRTSISNLFSSFNHSQRNKNNNGQTNSSITLVGTDRRHRLFGLNKTLSLDHHHHHHHHHQHHQHQRPTFHAHQAGCQQRPSSSSISTTVEMGRVDANVASVGTTSGAGQRTRPAGLLGRLLKFTGLFKLSAAIASSTSTSSSSSRRQEGGHTDHAGHTDRHDHSNHHDNLNVSINGFRSHEGQSNWRPRFKLVGRRAKPTTTTTRRRQAGTAKYEPPEGAKQHAPEINGTGGALAASLDLTGLEVLGSGKQLDYDETFESAKVAADRVAKIDACRKDKAADRLADSIRSTTGAPHNQAKSNASNGHPSSPLPGLIHLANRNEAQQPQLEGRKRRRLQLRRQQQQTGSESQEQRVPSRPFRWCKGFSVSSAGGESSTYTNSTMLTTMANDDQAACSDEGGASLTARGAPEFEQKSPRSLWKHQYQLSSTSSGVDLSTSASIRRPKAANGSQQVAGDKRTAKKSAHFNGGGDYDEQVVDDDDENNNWRSASSNRRLISHQSGSCSRSSSIVISRSSSESNLAGDVTTTSFSKSNSSSSPDSMFHHERKTTMTTTEHHQQERRRILNRLAPGEAEPTSGHRIVSRFNSLKHDGDLEEEDQEEEQSDSLQARSGAQSTPFIRTELIDNEADPDDDLGRNERSMASAAPDQGERVSDESDEVFKRVKMICYVKGNVTNDKKLGRAPTSTASSASSSSASSPSSSLSMADNFEGRDNDDAKIKLSPLSDNNQPNQIKINPTEHRRISPSWGRENEVLVTELERKPLESPTNDNQIDEDEDDDESRPLRGERKPTTTTATTTTATTTTSGATKPEQANKMNSLVSMAQLTFEQNQCKRLQKRSGSQPIVSSHYHHQLMNHSSNHHHHNHHHHHHHHHNHLAAQSDFQAVRDISKKQQMDSRRQVVIMLAFVVACFFLLFFPYRVFTIWLILSTEDQVQSLGMETYYNLTYFSRILIYLHSAINPIAYNLISTKFRQAFMSILLCRGPATRRHFTTEHQRFLQTNTYNHHHQHVTSSIVHKTGSNPTSTTNAAGLLVKKQSLPPATHQQLTIVTK